jgi:NADH-quinone oxidoreductase subunit N
MLTTVDLFALLPLLIISGTAVIVMLAIAFFRHHSFNATLAVIGLNIALLASFMVWVVAPHAVTELLMIDRFSLLAIIMMLVATLASTTFAHSYMQSPQVHNKVGNREEFYLLLLLSLVGAIVLVSSCHFASLFIGLEILSIPLYGLVAYTLRHSRSLEAGIKYLVLSATGSAIMLFGMALIYAETGTLAFVGIGQHLSAMASVNPAAGSNLMITAGALLILIALSFKLSLAPFHLWTPDVYEGAPAPVGAYLATTAKIAVAYALMRLIAYVPVFSEPALKQVMLVLAGLSILVGNILAMGQNNIKRLLAYSSIAHFGYLMVAIAALNFATLEAFSVYLITYTLATLAAFGVITVVSITEQASGSEGIDADGLHRYRGLFWKQPYLAAVMTVAMLSLAGIPMNAGFIGKFYMILAAVNASYWWMLAIVVLGSAIGLYYYLRVVVTLFMLESGMSRHKIPFDWSRTAGGVVLVLIAAAVLFTGILPETMLEIVTLGSMQ